MRLFSAYCFAVLTVVGVSLQATEALAQTRFGVVLNRQTNFGDSRKSVTFYDADNLLNGPLFSVFTGFEAANNLDEPGSLAVDPATGDAYVIAFDSGDPTLIDSGTTGSTGEDQEGDYDLLKVNFSTVFNHWKTNFEGHDVRGEGLVDALSPAPTASASSNPFANQNNLDYVTYGAPSPSFSAFDFAASHSNTFTLAGSIEKVGEVKRNVGDTTGAVFHTSSLEFIDTGTLLMIDAAHENQDPNTATAPFDKSYRVIERVSTLPGQVPVGPLTAGDHLNGGFNNNGSSESWISRDIGLVNLDFDPNGVVTGHSEPESSSFYSDPVSGVRGMWVTESDGFGGGDDIAFMEIDGSNNFVGYRPHAVGVGPFPTSFALDNDPNVSATTNDGKADNIFVDQDTGDLIIIESGFGDFTDGIGPDHEPGVIRREVTSYDDGTGKIDFGAWSAKVILNPIPESAGENPSFLERGSLASYDSVNDLVYFWNFGSFGENPAFGMDVWVLDINTGITTAFLDLDESVFFTGAFADVTDFFTLVAGADFDGSGIVDGLDFLQWQRGNTPGGGSPAELVLWEAQYGGPPPLAAAVASSAVPEPATVVLLGISLASLGLRRRRENPLVG